jgi:quercetin dioxygenase-like cupin family protein
VQFLNDLENREVKTVFPGVGMRTFWGEKMLLAVVDLAAGAVVPTHSHPHEQAGTVLSGRMALTVDGETRWVEPGDSYIILGDIAHSARAGDSPTRVLEVFCPIRPEYQY